MKVPQSSESQVHLKWLCLESHNLPAVCSGSPPIVKCESFEFLSVGNHFEFQTLRAKQNMLCFNYVPWAAGFQPLVPQCLSLWSTYLVPSVPQLYWQILSVSLGSEFLESNFNGFRLA